MSTQTVELNAIEMVDQIQVEPEQDVFTNTQQDLPAAQNLQIISKC